MAFKRQLVSNGMAVNLADSLSGTNTSSLALTGAGTTVADAVIVTGSWLVFTTVAANTGTILPPMEIGDEVWIANLGASTLKIYPAEARVASGAAFNLGAGDAVLSLVTATNVLIKKVSALQYVANVSA